jgi:alpha-amylase/alpha-mannosidase (GH57 family)
MTVALDGPIVGMGGEAHPNQTTATQRTVYITIHGHFYQPPRENPYLERVERQPSATPFHDWNERICAECYRPNAFARIFNDYGEVLAIVNNYEYLSFNIGPTLLSWLENHDLEVYHRILEADRRSCERLGGHGNAMAQVYNHIILPLANERDKYTQVQWGKADFQYRFGREPEGLWLAETAVDEATLKVLIDEKIKFIVLAPSQAERCRPRPTPEHPEPHWQIVNGGQIDPTRPYRCFIADGRFIDIFFYDGPISRDMGFGDVLNSSEFLAGRLGQAVRGDYRPGQLLNVATDGETFGHHKGGTERCLAYAFTREFPQRGWQVTNYAHYLSLFPPQWEVELKPVTAWSCCHGVDRWQADCGCGGGGEWHQQWRKPLRESLNWLRDQLTDVYQAIAPHFFRDPWQARQDYIQIILDRRIEQVNAFLQKQQSHPLTSNERTDALRLLEMQRYSLLMFTSCGWFFEEISRPEGVQILRYAARALELAAEVTGEHLEADFIELLGSAPSNIPLFQNGQGVYHHLVSTAKITLEQVAAHYAISSLFIAYGPQHAFYCYQAEQIDFHKQQLGTLNLALGQVHLTSTVTWESQTFTFAVLHLGGWDFHCCIQPTQGRGLYGKLKQKLLQALTSASAAQVILAMGEYFGPQSFGLPDLFAEDRQRIMQILTATTQKNLDQLYTQVYRDNYSILVAFQRDELPVPPELQVAAEIALAHRCLQTLQQLSHHQENLSRSQNLLQDLTAIATEANYLNCTLRLPEGQKILEHLILTGLQNLLAGELLTTELEAQAEILVQFINLGQQLKLSLNLDRPQELYFYTLQGQSTLPRGGVWLKLGRALSLSLN